MINRNNRRKPATLGGVKMNILLTCDQGNFNQIVAWSRNRTLVALCHQHSRSLEFDGIFVKPRGKLAIKFPTAYLPVLFFSGRRKISVTPVSPMWVNWV